MSDKALNEANNEIKKQKNNSLHGVTLEKLLTVLREHSWADSHYHVLAEDCQSMLKQATK
ncbi:MAG: hypothetical protein ACQETH_15290 [Candidatus Rifleibacteriota bacterium]